jgi:hypothetical protein
MVGKMYSIWINHGPLQANHHIFLKTQINIHRPFLIYGKTNIDKCVYWRRQVHYLNITVDILDQKVGVAKGDIFIS